jgi:hypothetical protein
MAGFDELRKIKGYEPIFLPFLADIFIPDNESGKVYSEQRKLIAQLTQNKIGSTFNSEELEMVKNLAENKILSKEEAAQ